MLSRLLTACLASMLALPGRTSVAAPSQPTTSSETPRSSPTRASGEAPPSVKRTDPPGKAGSVANTIAAADRAWKRGEWSEVRSLLEPLAMDVEHLADPSARESVLAYLADATMNDQTLELSMRQQLASTYLARLMDLDTGWQMPTGIYSPELEQLWTAVRENRERALGAQCEADLNACRADRSQQREEAEQLEQKYRVLTRAYDDQEVEIRETVARSRVFALIPFGVGHFYNGNWKLGTTFITFEAAFGFAGLGLWLHRVIVNGCRRTNGFAPGSLRCTSGTQKEIVGRRKAEEVMGWFFIGTMALDVLLAQVLFKSFETSAVRRVKRRELRSGQPEAPPRRRPQKRRAKVRPTAAPLRTGASLGLDVEF